MKNKTQLTTSAPVKFGPDYSGWFSVGIFPLSFEYSTTGLAGIFLHNA